MGVVSGRRWGRALAVLAIALGCILVVSRPARTFREQIELLAVPRPPGSPGHAAVRSAIKTHFSSLGGWRCQEDGFVAATPSGPVPMANLVFTHGAAGPWLVLAAHYDSKDLPDFVGATDAAWSCALLLQLASVVTQRRRRLAVKIVFFDGEEAAGHWSPSDGLYGSRHLALAWTEPIRLFVLFDLLGSADSSLHPFDPHSLAYYRLLADTEAGLVARGRMSRAYCRHGPLLRDAIEDDHSPFLARFPGLPTLHMAPLPFPSVWHTSADNLAAIDARVSQDLQTLFAEFVGKL